MKKIITNKDLVDNQESQKTDTHKMSRDILLDARKKQLHNKTPKKDHAKTGFQWLTKNSRAFLAAGYIADNTEAEVRIRQISDRAEQILGIQGFSDKFYNSIVRKKI